MCGGPRSSGVGHWATSLAMVRSRTTGAGLVPADGSGAALALDLSTTPVQEHPRIHLDLYAGDSADQQAEVARLISLGAERVDWESYPDDADFVVPADPEGNRFCVIDTSHS